MRGAGTEGIYMMVIFLKVAIIGLKLGQLKKKKHLIMEKISTLKVIKTTATAIYS